MVFFLLLALVCVCLWAFPCAPLFLKAQDKLLKQSTMWSCILTNFRYVFLHIQFHVLRVFISDEARFRFRSGWKTWSTIKYFKVYGSSGRCATACWSVLFVSTRGGRGRTGYGHVLIANH